MTLPFGRQSNLTAGKKSNQECIPVGSHTVQNVRGVTGVYIIPQFIKQLSIFI